MAKIIIADDNKDLNSMLGEYLGSQNNLYVDKTFTTGKQVLSYLENNYTDILLLDIFMPEMDGISVLEELNRNAGRYKKPAHIIVFSAFTNEKLMAKASNLGAEYFIVKPIELNSVLNIINQLLKPNIVKNGDVISKGEDMQVIATPGHTQGHMCLYIEKYKLLIAGDLLLLKDGNITMCPKELNYNNDMYLQSVNIL